MTRAEALAAITTSWKNIRITQLRLETITEPQELLEIIEKASIIKFDEPRDKLYKALLNLVVEIKCTPCTLSTGRLSPFGVDCIIEFIEQQGFYIESRIEKPKMNVKGVAQ